MADYEFNFMTDLNGPTAENASSFFSGGLYSDLPNTPQQSFRESEIEYQNTMGTSAQPILATIPKTPTGSGFSLTGILNETIATAQSAIGVIGKGYQLAGQLEQTKAAAAIQKTNVEIAKDKAEANRQALKANASTGISFAGLGLFPLNSESGPKLLYIIGAGVGLYYLTRGKK